MSYFFWQKKKAHLSEVSSQLCGCLVQMLVIGCYFFMNKFMSQTVLGFPFCSHKERPPCDFFKLQLADVHLFQMVHRSVYSLLAGDQNCLNYRKSHWHQEYSRTVLLYHCIKYYCLCVKGEVPGSYVLMMIDLTFVILLFCAF